MEQGTRIEMREPKYNRLVFRGTVLKTMDNDVILLFKDYPDNRKSQPSGVEAKYLQVLDDQTPNESHLDLIYLHNKLKSLEGYWERAALKRYLYIIPPPINNGRNFRVYHTIA